MIPKIETIEEKKLVGKRMTMSYADYKVAALWNSFMPRRKEIIHTLSNELISFVIYAPTHFTAFSPTRPFERWAAVEVANFNDVPHDMETYTIPGGRYAVFHYKGSASDISDFYRNIYTVWLPNTGYILDNRPHFEVLGSAYKNNDPSSEEQIWIPIQDG